MATVGEATIKLAFDGKSLKASADKEAPKIQGALGKVGDMAKSAGKGLGKAVGLSLTAAAGAGIAAIAKLGSEATKQQAEFEQLYGGVETLFGAKGAQNVEEYAQMMGKSVKSVSGEFNKLMSAQNLVIDNADKAYKTAGLSMNEYLSQATSFSASLLQSLDGDTVKTAQVTDMAIIDMADNANKMGTSLDMIQNAYQGFAKQNYTMLDNLKLGYGGTKTEMERLLEDATKISGVKYDIKNLNDVFQAIHVIQGELGITGTTAKEASETISGSIGMMKSSWANLVGALADDTADFDSLLKNFTDSVATVGKNLLPVIKVAMKGVVRLIKELVPQIVKGLPGLIKELLPSLVEATVLIVVELAKMLPELMPIIVDGLVLLVTTLVPYIPTILGALINAIIQSVVALFTSIGKYIGPWLSQTLSDIGTAIGNWFAGIGTAISMFLGDFAQAAVEKIDAFAQGFWQAIENIKNWFASIPAFFASVIGKIADKVRQFGAKVGDVVGGAFKAVVNGVLGFIENFINAPIRAINGLIDTINSVPGIDLGRLNEFHLPRLAKGGLATGSTLANIGEAGAEAVIPLERNTDTWAGPLARAIADQFSEQGIGGAGGITVYMTNNINNNLDADEIGQRLMTSIRRAA